MKHIVQTTASDCKTLKAYTQACEPASSLQLCPARMHTGTPQRGSHFRILRGYGCAKGQGAEGLHPEGLGANITTA